MIDDAAGKRQRERDRHVASPPRLFAEQAERAGVMSAVIAHDARRLAQSLDTVQLAQRLDAGGHRSDVPAAVDGALEDDAQLRDIDEELLADWSCVRGRALLK